MKNLKRYSELNEGGKAEIWPEVQATDEVVNILYLLIDDGHFDQHGFPKNDLESVNAAIDEAGLGGEEAYFKSAEDMNKFTDLVKDTLQTLASRL